MAEQAELFAEQDVIDVARVVHSVQTGCEIEHIGRPSDEDEETARAVLDALAKAGRLFPPGYWYTAYIEGTMVDALFPDGEHRYWSTHCRHDNHEACSADVLLGDAVYFSGMAGTNLNLGKQVNIRRRPAQCKTCAAQCVCPCHQVAP